MAMVLLSGADLTRALIEDVSYSCLGVLGELLRLVMVARVLSKILIAHVYVSLH